MRLSNKDPLWLPPGSVRGLLAMVVVSTMLASGINTGFTSAHLVLIGGVLAGYGLLKAAGQSDQLDTMYHMQKENDNGRALANAEHLTQRLREQVKSLQLETRAQRMGQHRPDGEKRAVESHEYGSFGVDEFGDSGMVISEGPSSDSH